MGMVAQEIKLGDLIHIHPLSFVSNPEINPPRFGLFSYRDIEQVQSLEGDSFYALNHKVNLVDNDYIYLDGKKPVVHGLVTKITNVPIVKNGKEKLFSVIEVLIKTEKNKAVSSYLISLSSYKSICNLQCNHLEHNFTADDISL